MLQTNRPLTKAARARANWTIKSLYLSEARVVFERTHSFSSFICNHAEINPRDQGFPFDGEEERCEIGEDQEEQRCGQVQGPMLQISLHFCVFLMPRKPTSSSNLFPLV
ncbi:uncharacterized protein LOC109830790 [Asparagus officinalis]|uniref:uncharacterized protein LOC109830790 n=1 Tax=Asparagus officinalis TaxID=4686 RepID=UPI00098E0E39|nr:uncharacterized protein LOC109830790 [Asparagus officinalis]